MRRKDGREGPREERTFRKVTGFGKRPQALAALKRLRDRGPSSALPKATEDVFAAVLRDLAVTNAGGDAIEDVLLAMANDRVAQCWNQPLVDGRPGISSNSSVSLKSNSFSMILEPLI